MNKTHIYQCFVKFKLLVENLFSIKIKYHKFDNGREYSSFQFKRFLFGTLYVHNNICFTAPLHFITVILEVFFLFFLNSFKNNATIKIII